MSSADLLAGRELEFEDGLVGLPWLHRFAVDPVAPGLVELRCLDDPDFGFVAASADEVRPGVTDDLVERGVVDPGTAVLVLLSVHGDPPVVTANLAGPIGVDADARGRQYVIEDPAYPLREPVPTAG